MVPPMTAALPDFGTVFKVSETGKETVLHSFAGGSSDGNYPFYAGLLMDTEGNLYGDTYYGGASNEGVVYKLSKSGTLTVLHSFTGGTTDGCYPYGTPVMDKQGKPLRYQPNIVALPAMESCGR